MSIRFSVAAVAAAAALGATLTGFGAADSAGAVTARERCEMRCRGSAACFQECENLTPQTRRTRRVIVIRIPPPEEPPVAKSWIGPVFNPSTGGGGGGGGGGGAGR